ncbi:MAG: M48 family metallopeptidase [Candidatus Omnitrophota bacterium]|nr:M48 family metallopeptidase [Candidatus Omnitrophota bacterium]
MEVKIVRSRRRLRTVSARLVKDMLLVQAPAVLPQGSLEKIIAGFKLKFERKKLKEDLDKKHDLKRIAGNLNEKYFGNKLKIDSIEYVTGQNSKFGCCNYRTANIRISHRIGLMPEWVREYVLIHEMAHLIEPNHSKAFWEIVSRYRLAERARGFLMAAGLDIGEDNNSAVQVEAKP